MRTSVLAGPRLPVVAMGAAAIAASLMLIPSGREMALLRIEAGESYLAASILQARIAAGDRSPATMAALARALTALGDVAGAARLLEGVVADRPRDPAALEALAGFQRSAGRTEGLVRTLQALQEVAPTGERLREIARLHAGAGREAEQRQALRTLVERFSAEPADYLALARLESARGQHLVGVAVLQALVARHPRAMEDASIVALELGMLLAGGEPERALARARHWLGGRNELGQTAPVLAGALSVGGRPDLAVALLEPHAGSGAAPQLIAALAQAESDAGNPGAALRRLEQLDATPEGARGGEEVALLRLRLALAVGDTDRAVAAAERAGWPTAQGELLRRLSAIALATGRTDAIRRVLQSAGGEFLASDPVLAARLHLALGDMEAARRWSERAMAAIVGRPEEDVQLADVEVRLGRMDRALELLRRAVSERGLPPTMPWQIANIFVRTGRPDEGALLLDELRRRQPSDAAESAWALAAAAGHASEVAAWLSAPGKDELSPDILQDLTYLAADAGARDLAIAAAERLFAVRGSPADALLLARLLLDAGRARQALERLHALPPGTHVPEDFRTAVLLAAWRQGAPVADAVRALWLRRLRAATDPAARNEAILALTELRAHADVLPVLRNLAEQDPEHWLWAFGNAATAVGRRADLLALWAELSRRPGLSPDLRRQLGFRLLDAGDKRAAELALRALAVAAPPTSRDVRQLLFLWGPRPAAEQLDWLEARARAASGQDRVAWMRLLTDRGAPNRAIAIYRATPRNGAPAGALDAYLDALEVLDDKVALVAAAREELPGATSADQLRRLAYFSARGGDATMERHALERWAAAGGGPEAQRRLGTLAYLRRDMDSAERHLSDFVAATGGDHEACTLLGDIAAKRRDAAAALQHYAKALRLLQASEDRAFQTRMARANLLHRLGRDAEARQAYEELIAERPEHRSLRADYVAMLMKQGALRQAHDVLAGR
jgi:predicted Zn-dependent protease